MTAAQPLPAAVQAEVLNVVWTAFYYRDDLKAVMLAAGVPRNIYARYDQPDIAKVKIARHVLDELNEMGAEGWAIQRKIAVELCTMNRPANGVADVKAGKAALAQLRSAAMSARIVVDTEQAAIDDRKAREAKRQKLIDDRRRNMEQLAARFAELSATKTRTAAERQKRGYELESLLVGLFKAHELDYTGSRRLPHEQIDGSFFFRGFTYLVEARWRTEPPILKDLADFKFKVDSKLDSTRGMFISMAGFNEEILGHFGRNSGPRNNIIYVTGQDLALIFGGHIGLVDALSKKIDAAESRGEYLIDLVE